MGEHGPDPTEATLLLRRAVGGDEASAAALFDVVYGELHRLAWQVMGREREDHTLQPTALVHEAFLRLVGMDRVNVQGRDEFLSLAARAMRRVLVDHARGRQRDKRGGAAGRVVLDEAVAEGVTPETTSDVTDVDRALTTLAERSPRQAKVVELRFFGGLSNATVARILEISEATVERDWRAARAWLTIELRQGS